VPESLEPGSVVGTLASVDVDSGDVTTFTLLDSAAGRFQIVANELLLVHPLDHEVSGSHEVRIEALDSAGNTYMKTITIQVSDVDETEVDINDTAPVFTSANSASIDENTTLVLQLTATDEDTTGEPILFQIDPATADGALFSIEGDVLSFQTAPDFEGAHSPFYTVEVIASDGVNSSRQLLSVEVRDVAESANSAPTDLTLSATTIGENAAAGRPAFRQRSRCGRQRDVQPAGRCRRAVRHLRSEPRRRQRAQLGDEHDAHGDRAGRRFGRSHAGEVVHG
jgi:hypothetical protein